MQAAGIVGQIKKFGRIETRPQRQLVKVGKTDGPACWAEAVEGFIARDGD